MKINFREPFVVITLALLLSACEIEQQWLETDDPDHSFSLAFTIANEGNGQYTFDASQSSSQGSPLDRNSFIWSLGDGTELTGERVSHRYETAGSMNVVLSASNDLGIRSSLRRALQVTLSGFTFDFSQSSNFFGVAPLNVRFDASRSTSNAPITAYTWKNGDGEVLSTEANFEQVFSSGVFPLTLTLTNGDGESATQSILINATELVQDRRDPNAQKYLVRKETVEAEQATTYLQRLLTPLPDESPETDRSTFLAWYNTNTFPDSEWTNARYFNGGDLGFGRDMYCNGSEALGRIACYTTNYGNLGSDGTDIHAALIGVEAGEFAFATVAMEFIANAPEGETVRFFAFAANNSVSLINKNPAENLADRLERINGPAVSQVELDSEGIKNLPGACIICHGGKVDADNPLHDAQQIVTGSGFLPFDAEVFSYLDSEGTAVKIVETVFDENTQRYVTQDTASINDPLVKQQIAAIQQNNAFVVLQQRLDAKRLNPDLTNAEIAQLRPIVEFLENTPARHGGLAADDAQPYLPTGFANKPDVYEHIIKPYCRGCHFSQYQATEYNLKQYNQFHAQTGCIDDLLMPQAELTDRHLLLATNLTIVRDVLAKQDDILHINCAPRRVIDAIPINPVQAFIPTTFHFNDRKEQVFEFTTPVDTRAFVVAAVDVNQPLEKDLRVPDAQPITEATVYATEIRREFFAGVIEFDIDVQTLTDVDVVSVFLDDQLLAQYSGNQYLLKQQFPVSAGEHSFRIVYNKTDPNSALNRVRIDNLRLPLAFIDTRGQEFIQTFEALSATDINAATGLPQAFRIPTTATKTWALNSEEPLADNTSLGADAAGAEVSLALQTIPGDLQFAYTVKPAASANVLQLLIDDVIVAEYTGGSADRVRMHLPGGPLRLTWRLVGAAPTVDGSRFFANIDQIVVPIQ